MYKAAVIKTAISTRPQVESKEHREAYPSGAGYVEDFDEPRTPLDGVFIILSHCEDDFAKKLPSSPSNLAPA